MSAHIADTHTTTEQPYAPLAPAHQWAATTPGRTAPDGYTWMQSVHWVHGAGLHQPTHGPAFCDTTIRIARICAALNPCRPSVAYLMRVTGLSERTVQNHLAILRNTGLLAYKVKGGRRKGATALASEFVRVIPPAFDTALGIRTVGDGPSRRMVGIAEHGRKAIAKLAKLAAAKGRKKRVKKASAAEARCTPMEGGTTGTSSDGGTHSPSESKLASGEPTSPIPKKPTSAPRKLNLVGRRWQLAGELIRRVEWLNGCAQPRIAWVVRPVADAGWTADQVIAWLGNAEPPQTVHRASGFLAHRLRAAVAVWTTPAARREATEAWRDARNAAKPRHVEWETGEMQGPRSLVVKRLVAEAVRRCAGIDAPDAVDIPADAAPVALEGLSRDTVIDMRAAAQADHGLIHAAIATLGEPDTRRLYTNRLVDEALAIKAIADRRPTFAAF